MPSIWDSLLWLTSALRHANHTNASVYIISLAFMPETTEISHCVMTTLTLFCRKNTIWKHSHFTFTKDFLEKMAPPGTDLILKKSDCLPWGYSRMNSLDHLSEPKLRLELSRPTMKVVLYWTYLLLCAPIFMLIKLKTHVSTIRRTRRSLEFLFLSLPNHIMFLSVFHHYSFLWLIF